MELRRGHFGWLGFPAGEDVGQPKMANSSDPRSGNGIVGRVSFDRTVFLNPR
jgi:hypothetical protein